MLEQRSPSELETYLIALWERMDDERMGRLPVSTLSQALRTADLGLNKIQVHSVVGEAPVEEDGCADYYRSEPPSHTCTRAYTRATCTLLARSFAQNGH